VQRRRHDSPLQGELLGQLLSVALLAPEAERALLDRLATKPPSEAAPSAAAPPSAPQLGGAPLFAALAEPISAHFAVSFAALAAAVVRAPNDGVLLDLLLAVVDFLIGHRKYLHERCARLASRVGAGAIRWLTRMGNWRGRCAVARVVFLETLTQSDAMISAMARHAPVAQLQVLWLRMARLDPRLLSRSSTAFAEVGRGGARGAGCVEGAAGLTPARYCWLRPHRPFAMHT